MRSVLLAGALAAGALVSSPANAGTDCFGEDSLAYVCVVTPEVGVGTWTLCVHAGGTECQPVDVPFPTVDGGGGVRAYCGGPMSCNVLEVFDWCALGPDFC